MEDLTLTCRDCIAPFVFCAGEQEWFRERGFTDDHGRLLAPTRCLACRSARKRDRLRAQR